MKLIAPPLKKIDELIGKQKELSGKPTRLTTCCEAAECGEGLLLYHTLTGTMALVPPEAEWTAEDRTQLSDNWYLVEAGFDEHQFVDEVHKILRMTQCLGEARTDFTILTTTACNARCYYCYEKGVQGSFMTSETGRDTAEYMMRVSKEKPISIRWFGGEPLYHRKAIEIICGALNREGVQFQSSMVSNGYYLEEETVRRAKEDWHLRKVQITLDGTEDHYNRVKAYIDRTDATSPFQRVLRNIRGAADAGIQVTIRLNMDRKNAADLRVLTDQLIKRFEGNKQIGVYPALLQPFAGKVHGYATAQEAIRDYDAIAEKLEMHGLRKEAALYRSIRVNRCMADSDHSEVILPDGRIGRCEHFSEDMITGSLYDGERNAGVIKAWKEPLTEPECGQCSLYPICTRLKKCQWNQDGCPEAERMIAKRTLQRQMLRAYLASKAEGKS